MNHTNERKTRIPVCRTENFIADDKYQSFTSSERLIFYAQEQEVNVYEQCIKNRQPQHQCSRSQLGRVTLDELAAKYPDLFILQKKGLKNCFRFSA
jgi:hypothetical protein